MKRSFRTIGSAWHVEHAGIIEFEDSSLIEYPSAKTHSSQVEPSPSSLCTMTERARPPGWSNEQTAHDVGPRCRDFSVRSTIVPRISSSGSFLRIDMKVECKITRFQSEGESGTVGLGSVGATPKRDGDPTGGSTLDRGCVDGSARAPSNCIGHAHGIPKAFR